MVKISKADLSLHNLKKLIKKEFNETDKLIKNQINSDVNRIPKLSKHIIDLGGKRLRPMLTISCAKMLKIRNKNHIKLAAAVELLHTATLLHDDVVDESVYRRGEKTSHTLWDNKSSILVGDFLLGKAFQLMVETNSIECLSILSKAAAIIAEGEVLQLVETNNINIKETNYIKIIESKTAALFSSACEVGGVVSGANKSQKKKLFNFGKNLGTAFQLTDDALDYEGSSSKMGKNNGDDFYEGKVTLPVILALKNADKKEKDFWEKTFNKKVRNKTDLRIAKKIIKDKDTINQTLKLANKYGEKAKNIMKDFESNPVRNALIDLVDFSLVRNY
ncbi:MAG: polyprenyl synthetase family protein [Alphaproteobacteria bacterium]